jgi:serine/threonine protein kinase
VNMIEHCKRKVPEHVVLAIFKDICKGVEHLHNQGICHRDLKVENILLKDQKFKIADFGSAVTQDGFLSWN